MEMINTIFAAADLEAEEKHASAFKALSHKTRLAIFYHLVRKGEAGDTVGNLQEAVAIPWATLSHHLDVLHRADLLESRRKERYVFYRVRPERVSDLYVCLLRVVNCPTEIPEDIHVRLSQDPPVVSRP